MEREALRLASEPLHMEKTWESDGIIVLAADITLPQCEGGSRRARRFNRYYRSYARAYLHYCEEELLPRAAEEMRTAMERSAPWTMARATLGYTVTLLRGEVLSLYTDAREEHLRPRLTLRRAETWSLSDALPLPLSLFFPPRTALRRTLVKLLRAQATERVESETAVYYPNYRATLRRAWSSRNFYLAPDGVHIFYPMYTLAPAVEGIVEFTVPYGDGGPFEPMGE